jgi:sec-independent protein translocase protein TatA
MKLFDNGPLLVILLVAAIVIFGSKRLPDAARGVGRSLRIFKAETKGLLSDDDPPAGQQVPPMLAQPVQAPVPQPAGVPVPPQPPVAAAQPLQQPAPVDPPPAAPVVPEADQHQG